MAFRIELAPQAVDDLDRIAAYIGTQGSSEAARVWFEGIVAALKSLRQMPSRCPIAEESQDLAQEIRVLLHGSRNRSYKIYFSISKTSPRAGVVRVFHVRHWARRRANADDLRNLLTQIRGTSDN